MNIIFQKLLFIIIIISVFYINTLKSSDKISDIKVPEGFNRIDVEDQSFASYLRQLNLKPVGSKVKYYDGKDKPSQKVHYRIIDLDIGQKDLQQCADAIIRLRAEYFFSIGDFNSIHFNFTNGDTARYSAWMQGYRPQINKNIVSWLQVEQPQNTYKLFRKYLETVFTYSGSFSLEKELIAVENMEMINIGNVFIQGGFPGHAIIVLDLAKSINDNRIAVLLAQSYMPAQDIHILVNENNTEMSPWYLIGQGDRLYTPEWTFDWVDLYKFK